MSRPQIEPRNLRGFRDTMPGAARRRREMLQTIERSFSSFGYEPIQTPALEYAEILKGKGGQESDKQMFEFTDQGGREVAMRFDLTVPLARFVAQHQNELTFPFRAYQVGYVWRGERPQKGRYREFFQCDADIIGVTGAVADAEIITMIASAIAALDIGNFRLKVNDRRVLNGLLADLDLTDRGPAVLRALDKLDKAGEAAVRSELAEASVAGSDIGRILGIAQSGRESNAETFAAVAEQLSGSALATEGLDALAEVLDLVAAAGIPGDLVVFDPSIARGLDYYTGIVYETTLLDAPEVGSISSGGRYDDLAGLYTSRSLPGVGGSIGVSRILAAVEDRGLARSTPLVVIAHPEDGGVADLVALATRLRALGVDVAQYPVPRKHQNQMKFANARDADIVLTLADDGTVMVKELGSGTSTKAPLDQVPEAVADALRL